MLLQFLWQATKLVADDGLVMITSKDVKPYTQWRLEDRVHCFPEFPEKKGDRRLTFFGKLPFLMSDFPGYKSQNVGRDSLVKDTQAMTYIYGFESTLAFRTTARRCLDYVCCC